MSVHRRLLSLAWPIVGVNVLNVLALAVDTAMIGRLPQAEDALTGLGYATQVVFLLMVGMIGLTVGTVASVARAHGAHQPERVDHLLAQSTWLTVILGLSIALLGNGIAPAVLRLLGANDATTAAGLAYLRPLLLGTVFNYLNLLFAAVLRGVGNTRLAFVVALGMNGLNATFNAALIFGAGLGITGAAIGTVAAQALAVAAYVVLLRWGAVPGIVPSLRPRPIDWQLARELFRVGGPSALDLLVFNAGFLSIVGMLGRIDQTAVAAHGVGLRIQALAFVPGMSISQATGALVGNALGAGSIGKARAILRAAVLQCTAIMSVIALVQIVWAVPLVSLFDVAPDTELGRYSVTWIQLLGYGMPLVGVWVALAGMFQGAGDTRTTLWINGVVTVLQIPASWLLGFPLGLGALGVWLAFPAGFVLKVLLALGAYRRGRWAHVGVSPVRAPRGT